jgi:adenylate cyclase
MMVVQDSSTRRSTFRSSSRLVIDKGSFKSFLAPLKRDTFQEVVADVEGKLEVVNQTLSMLDVLRDDDDGSLHRFLKRCCSLPASKQGNC